MKEILEKLIKEDGYRFEKPWRTSSKALSFVIPIVMEHSPTPRGYYLIEEVKEKVTIEDTGNIGEVRVKGDVDKPVFFRGGHVLEGVGTQSRAVRFDVVIMPEKEEIVKVHCVHASHPIAKGRKFRISGIAPRTVSMALLSGNQHATWSAVSHFANAMASTHYRRASGRIYAAYQPIYSDSLVDAMRTVDAFREEVKKKLEKVPATLENQVGIVVLDAKGVVGLELFDHPESWKAFSDSIIRNYEDILTEEAEAPIFKLDEQGATLAIKKFLESAKNCEDEKVWSNEISSTHVLKGDEVVGQYTTLRGKTIHLLLSRKEGGIREEAPQRLVVVQTVTPTVSADTTTSNNIMFETSTTSPYRYFERRGAFTFLDEILERPKTWRELEPKFRSPVTLSRRAKEALWLGLAEKAIRPTNGRVVYKITDKGKLWLSKIKGTQ